MLFSAMQCACLLLAGAVGADGPAASPPLKGAPDPIPVKKPRHFVVQVKLIEVDEQGRETLLGEPKLQTTGGNAGLSIDHPDGRRFEFIMKLTDRLGTGEELIPAKSVGGGPVDTVQKKLEQKIDLNFRQQSRKEILRDLAKRAGVTIALDPESVKSIVAELESPMDLKVKDEPISAVLDRVIEPLNLAYAVKHDVLLIASADKLLPGPDDFVIKTYDVADLVKKTIAANGGTPDFAPLIERIKMTVMPASWERKEANATIRSFDSTLSIVVRQTAPGHAAIDRLLDKIRKEMPLRVPE